MKRVAWKLLGPLWNLYVDVEERFRRPAEGMVGFDKYRRVGAYHWRLLEKDPLYQQRVEAVASVVRRQFRCLDLGCGDGAYIGKIAPLCEHVVGVDGDPSAIRLARRELRRRGIANVALIQRTFSRLDLPGLGDFDLVWSMDCIEHLADPSQLLGVMRETVRVDGLVMIGTPLFAGNEHVSPYHVREYKLPELRDLLSSDFRVARELFLPARLSDQSDPVDRFYVFLGRKK